MSTPHPHDGAWVEPMREAVRLSLNPDVFRSANPRVGCVIVATDGSIVGRGWHRGAGTDHAEVMALSEAGNRARGATAVVTLEPCAHTGRTGPCAVALIDAGITRVVFAVADPFPPAAGGAALLRAAGIDVIEGVLADDARYANRAWTHVRIQGRPLVTVKMAVSLDGRVADASGGPTAITGRQARAHAHVQRALVDAIVVGTGTALADDPHLTARMPDGELAPRQPLRVVMGTSDIPAQARVRDDEAPTVLVRSRDPRELMSILTSHDVQHVLVEGGPTFAAALLEAELVDELSWYISPVLLCDGPLSLPALDHPIQVTTRRVELLGEDVYVEGVVDVHRDR